jgi:hypothetical protein
MSVTAKRREISDSQNSVEQGAWSAELRISDSGFKDCKAQSGKG